MKKKLLLTGVSGFLGWNICRLYKQEYDILGIYHSKEITINGVKTSRLDITDGKQLINLFQTYKPDAVIHLAALSTPNYCQLHEQESYKVNVESSVLLANLCADIGASFVFTSTDLVFDGKSAPYAEHSKVAPVSIYGEHKAKAEEGVQKIYPKAAICRMPLMYGDSGPTAASWLQDLLHKLNTNQEIKLFTDEFRTSVSGTDAAKGIMLMLEKKHEGIIHLGGKERLSRYDFGLLVKEIFRLTNVAISGITQAEIKMAAPRPSDVSLDSSKAFSLGYHPFIAREELQKIFEYSSLEINN